MAEAAHDKSPNNEDANNVNSWSISGNGLTKGRDNHDKEFDTVYDCIQIAIIENRTMTYTSSYDRGYLLTNRRELVQPKCQRGSRP